MKKSNVINIPTTYHNREPLSKAAAAEAAQFQRHLHQLQMHLDSERRMREALPAGSVRNFKIAEIKYLSDDLQQIASSFLRVLEQRP